MSTTAAVRRPVTGPVGLDRRGAALTLVVTVALLVVLSAVLVPWDWVPGGDLRSPPAGSVFDSRQVAAAEDYSRHVRWLSLSAYAVNLVLTLVLGLTPLGARLLRRTAGRVSGRWWVHVVLAVLLVTVLQQIVTLPFGLAIRARNLKVGLTDQALASWAADRGTALLVSWVTASLLVLVVVGAARRWPRRWFAAAAVIAAVFTFVASTLYPVVVEPLFNRFTPMADGPFKASLLQLADDAGVDVDDVLVADASRRTTTLNAYVSGLGATRRIVVYDTLLDGLDHRQVRSIVAHELGHAQHEDVLLGTGLGSLGALAAVAGLALVTDNRVVRRRAAVSGPSDPAAVALLLALAAAATFLASPVQESVSRAIEARADRFGLELTGDPVAFDAVQVQLARRSLADPTPPRITQFWFGSHPTVLQRLGIAQGVSMQAQAAGEGSGGGGSG